MKIVQLYKPEDFGRIARVQFYDLWWRQALKESQIATLFGVTKEEVAKKRKAFNFKWINTAMSSVSGTNEYRSHEKIVVVKPPKDWDGKMLKLPKMKDKSSAGQMSNDDLLDAVTSKNEKSKANSDSKAENTTSKDVEEKEINLDGIAEQAKEILKYNNEVEEARRDVVSGSVQIGDLEFFLGDGESSDKSEYTEETYDEEE